MDDEQTRPDAEAAFRFENLPPVSFVETDRYCEGCGYNLRTQAIRRDSRTSILLARCPECARFHAATDATTVSRRWLRRLAPLMLLTWLLLMLNGIVGTFSAAAGLSYGTLDELTRYKWNQPAPLFAPPATTLPTTLPQVTTTTDGATVITMGNQTVTFPSTGGRQRSYQIVVRDDDPYQDIFVASLLGLSTLLGFLSVLLMAVAMHHWRRRIYGVISVVMPLLAAALIGVVWYYEAPALFRWGLPFIAGHALAQIVGGLTGVAFGRLTARGLVRAFVPSSWRGPLAYLWLVDGKTPPGAAPSVVG